MLGIKELKKKIEITDTTVECPVIGCDNKIKRQRRGTKRPKCPSHNIFISPTTFSYQNETDNMLWTNDNDITLFNCIKKVKRESRIEENNSEDAVSWNMFRYLEKNNLTSSFLKGVLGIDETESEIVYWSYSQSDGGVWSPLRMGREEFELNPSKGSEPDLIIIGKRTLIIIEAKFGASNRTTPSKLHVEDKYVSGGENWWNEVFSSDFTTLAVKKEKYELARFWLIGSWVAKQLNLDFYLVNLTLYDREKNIEQAFKKHIINNNSRIFKRITWEGIYEFISQTDIIGHDKERIIKYFENMSMGYDNNGDLQRAFSKKGENR